MKVYLGGTCSDSTWRDVLIPQLEIDYFNPVVEEWTPECLAEEWRQREVCDICLYVITPKMTGVLGVAEAVDDSNKRPERTLFCFLERRDGEAAFSEHQVKSLNAVGKMIQENGATWEKEFDHLADRLNRFDRR